MTARRDRAVALAALLLLLAGPQAGCLQLPPRGCSASLHQQQPSTERQVAQPALGGGQQRGGRTLLQAPGAAPGSSGERGALAGAAGQARQALGRGDSDSSTSGLQRLGTQGGGPAVASAASLASQHASSEESARGVVEEAVVAGNSGSAGPHRLALTEADVLRYLVWCLSCCAWILAVFGFLFLISRTHLAAEPRRKAPLLSVLSEAALRRMPSQQFTPRAALAAASAAALQPAMLQQATPRQQCTPRTAASQQAELGGAAGLCLSPRLGSAASF